MTDWNAISDNAFRKSLREVFTKAYPDALRHLPHRPTWDQVKEWHAILHDLGWVAPAWPTEHGGMGLEPGKLLIFYEEQQRAGVTRGRDLGVQMVGPLIIRHGTPEQKAYWLPRMLSCEDLWCQGYSEPGSGSDLASLRCAARREGDEFVIDGQKIWTTMAQDSTHIFMLVRTDPKPARRQDGISFLLVAMDQPGITVRPIPTLAGDAEFCEVFFDGARAPADNLVGEIDKGWAIAKTLLGFERIFIGAPMLAQHALWQLTDLAQSRGAFADDAFRDRFAALALDVEDHAALYERFAERLRRGEDLGADVSMLKIWVTETYQKLTELMVEVAGPDGASLGGLSVGNGAVDALGHFMKSRSPTIYGGTNEVQRNILAQTVLNLPRGA